MKFPKILFTILILTLTISFASASDVAYVLKNTASPNSVLISSLNQINISYSLVDDSLVSSTNFSNYKMILVQDEISSLVSIVNNFPGIVISDYYSSSWSAGAGSFASSQILKGENVMSSPLNIGMPQQFNLYTSCCAGGTNLKAYYLNGKKYGAIASTHQTADIYDYIVAYKENPRRVFFGITETSFWSSDTTKLFKNSVSWIINGADTDGDGVYDVEDNCPIIANPNQTDTDSDGIGDVCDACVLDSQNDADSDGKCANVDNCPINSNPGQENFDADSLGDVCDNDIDNDGVLNIADDCDYSPFGFIIQTGGCGIANHLILNELEFNNPGTDTDEFIELYNPTNETISLTGWRIQDSRGRVDIISHGEIQAYGYFVFSESLSTLDFLNNDSIRLYDVNGSLIDETPFLQDNSDDEYTWQRNPDASEVWRFGLPTRGKNNNADVIKPEVTLISPNNNALVTSEPILFNYTAKDNKALALSCNFYANMNGAFRSLGNDTINNGTINYFFGNNIPDGTYIWNIKCSDGSNSAFSSQNRTIIINKPDAPIFTSVANKTINENETLSFSVNATDADGDSLTYSAINLPTGASFINRVFLWIPSFSQAGNYILKFIVSDGLLEDEMNVSIQVNDVNRQPSLTQDIPNKYFDEDSYVEINLSLYFSDPDGNSLSYKLENNTEIKASFINNIARFNSTKDWNGIEELVISANDSQYEVSSNIFAVAVLPVNDAPDLASIADISINEGQTARINASASDVDSSNLTYSINNSRFSQADNIFTWGTDYSDSGVYYFNVTASDSLLEDSGVVKITVTDVNEPPHFNPIDNIVIDEDSNFSSYNITAYDNDGNITSYSIAWEDLNKVDCRIDNSGLLEVKPRENFYGFGYCEIRAQDNSNSVARANATIQVNNINDAPVFSSFSPNFNPKIPEDSGQLFSIQVQDIDNNSSELEIKWYKDEIEIASGNSYNFSGDGTSKEYNITASVSDGEFNISRKWILETSNIPITEKYNGDTSDFSIADLQNASLILEKIGFGKIEFLELVNLENVVDLDIYSDIQIGLAGIDTNIFSSLRNKKAKITLYSLNYDKTPAIYYKSGYSLDSTGASLCSSPKCTNINYDLTTRIFSFEADGFSSYFAGNTLTCSQKGGRICSNNQKCLGSLLEARDSNSCCSSTCVIDFKSIGTCENSSSRIKVDIKNPDEDDEFFVGYIIPVELRVENSYDEEKEFDIRVILYDLAKQEEIDDWDDSISIDEDEREELELEIEIPDDIDENDEFYLYAIAEDGNLGCNENNIKIDISRNKHMLVIEDFNINEIISCDSNLNAQVKIVNLGRNEENTLVELEIPELNISKEVRFNIEKYGGADVERLELSLEIPDDTTGGYQLILSADYGEAIAKESRNITIECVKKQTLALEIPSQILTQETVELTGNNSSVARNIDWMLVIIAVLIIAIIIVFFMIIFKLSGRR